MALSLHLDESGIHAASPVVAVAGYIAQPDAWLSFDAEWKQIISELNTHLPVPVNYLHAAQFVGNFDEYRSLATKPLTKAAFLGRILDCIRKHALCSFAVAFQQRDFTELIGTDWTIAAGSPYSFALRMCMFLAAEWVRKHQPADERILYVMEKGNQFEKEADAFIRMTVEHENSRESLRYLDHLFVRKNNSPGCQAADVIVYETFRMLRAMLTDDQKLNWHVTPGTFGPRHIIYLMKRAAIEETLIDGLRKSEVGSEIPEHLTTLDDIKRYLKGEQNKDTINS
jgi:hypothetical protein